MTTELSINDVKVDHVVAGGPDKVPCTVLRIDHTTETVAPLAGRPCVQLWCRRQDTNQEGFLTFGPGALVTLLNPMHPHTKER
jgi:hypothetical protein